MSERSRFQTVCQQPLVYVVLDPSALRGDPINVAQDLLASGLKVLQLRDKNASGEALVNLTRALMDAAIAHDAFVIVNDRLDVALAAGAHGAHLGPHDIAIEDARRIAPGLILGGSAGDAERALQLQAQGADYLGCGAVFEARAMKPNASAPKSPALIGDVLRSVSIPVFGIGGITAQNAGSVMHEGASGVAVIREIVGADDPVKAFKILNDAVSVRE